MALVDIVRDSGKCSSSLSDLIVIDVGIYMQVSVHSLVYVERFLIQLFLD